MKTIFAVIVVAGLAFACFGGSTNELTMAEMNDVVVVTRTNVENGYLNAVDVFTRGGETNLVRRTQTRNGMVLFRSQNFYCNGADMGSYIYNGAESMIGSGPGEPYTFTYVFDRSNKLMSAIIGTIRTNAADPRSITVVTLDSFGCTNGVFYPRDGSWIRGVNSVQRGFRLP